MSPDVQPPSDGLPSRPSCSNRTSGRTQYSQPFSTTLLLIPNIIKLQLRYGTDSAMDGDMATTHQRTKCSIKRTRTGPQWASKNNGTSWRRSAPNHDSAPCSHGLSDTSSVSCRFSSNSRDSTKSLAKSPSSGQSETPAKALTDTPLSTREYQTNAPISNSSANHTSNDRSPSWPSSGDRASPSPKMTYNAPSDNSR